MANTNGNASGRPSRTLDAVDNRGGLALAERNGQKCALELIDEVISVRQTKDP